VLCCAGDVHVRVLESAVLHECPRGSLMDMHGVMTEMLRVSQTLNSSHCSPARVNPGNTRTCLLIDCWCVCFSVVNPARHFIRFVYSRPMLCIRSPVTHGATKCDALHAARPERHGVSLSVLRLPWSNVLGTDLLVLAVLRR
jgi:hypothetical protein